MNYYRSARRKVRTALTLSRGDWSILIKAWVWLLLIDLYLRSRPYPRVQQFVESRHRDGQATSSGQAWELIRRDQYFVLLAARNHLYQMGCLRQALTLKGLLGAHGITTQLRFGARKEADQLLAHAWLEFEDRSIEMAHNSKEHFEPLRTLEGRQ
jgi:hypothetical protein